MLCSIAQGIEGIVIDTVSIRCRNKSKKVTKQNGTLECVVRRRIPV